MNCNDCCLPIERCRCSAFGSDAEKSFFYPPQQRSEQVDASLSDIIHEVGQALLLLPEGTSRVRGRLRTAMTLTRDLRAALSTQPLPQPAGVSDDAEVRRRFEEWYEAESMPLEADWFKRDAQHPDLYEHAFVGHAWDGWRAALGIDIEAYDERQAALHPDHAKDGAV